MSAARAGDGGRSVAAHLLVSGRVQAVGFRAFTRAAARRCGAAGWVRNLSDGRVEAWAQGPRPVVEALVAALRSGPAHGRVDAVEVAWTEPEEGHGDFTIRR